MAILPIHGFTQNDPSDSAFPTKFVTTLRSLAKSKFLRMNIQIKKEQKGMHIHARDLSEEVLVISFVCTV